MIKRCKFFDEGGKCRYRGEYEDYDLAVDSKGYCYDENDCLACEFEIIEYEDEPKLTPTSEPMMMSFPIGGNDDMLDLISILNEVMYRFDHVDKIELKAVVSWFKTRYGGE